MKQLPILLSIVVLTAILGVTIPNVHADGVTHPVTLTVREKHIDPGKDGSHYIVVGTTGYTIEIDRVPFDWFTNIDAVWGTIDVGKTYTFNCWGTYVPMLNWYEICNSHN